MSGRHWTICALVTAVFVVAIWDTIAAGAGGYEDTITAVVREATREHPIIAFAAGVLAGHLFWY